MGFSLSGSTITQSGTDANASALAGVSGVTTLVQGSRTIYLIGDRNLVVSGTLSLDPRTEEIMIGSSAPYPCLDVSGTLNIGPDITQSGVAYFPRATALWIGRQAPNGFDDTNNASFRVAATGVVNHRFGSIYVAGPVGLISGSTYRTYSPSAEWISHQLASNGDTHQLRQRSANTDIDGITTYKINPAWIANASNWKRYSPFHCVSANDMSGSTPAQVYLTARDYVAGGGNDYDFRFRLKDRWFRFINASAGSSLVCVGNDVNAATPSNCGICEVRQEIAVTAKTVAGAAITSGGIFLRDRDHGSRCPTDAGFGGSQANYTSDRTYSANFNGSGIASIANSDGGILIAVYWRQNGGAQISSENKSDYRGESNNATDSWFCRVRSYGFYFSDISVVLKGTGGNAESVTLFASTDTVAAAGTAAAYTGISVTDHGGSPVSWNGGTFGITITGNRTTNPTLTAQQIHDYLQYHLSQVGTTFNGKPGGEWHNMLKRSGSTFFTERGTYGGSRSNKGVRVVDQAGNPFPGVIRHQDDSGTDIAVARATLLISGLVNGARYRAERADNGALIGDGTASGSTASIEYTHSGSDIAAVVRARKSSAAPKYLPAEQTVTLTNAGASVALTLTADPLAV